MAKSRYHEENPEAFTAYNRERTKKYRWEHPDQVRQYKKNEKVRAAEYRKEHRDEKNASEREKNRESIKTATNAGGPWTKEEIEKLKQMIIDGKPYSEISKALGRSIKSCAWAKSKYLKNMVTKYKQVNYIPTE